jgi:hypothetical protein
VDGKGACRWGMGGMKMLAGRPTAGVDHDDPKARVDQDEQEPIIVKLNSETRNMNKMKTIK